VLVPSTMELLGNANWWLPKWLDRALPVLGVEAETEADADVEPEAPSPLVSR
jgi:putative drug exporter of the RND superfamily